MFGVKKFVSMTFLLVLCCSSTFQQDCVEGGFEITSDNADPRDFRFTDGKYARIFFNCLRDSVISFWRGGVITAYFIRPIGHTRETLFRADTRILDDLEEVSNVYNVVYDRRRQRIVLTLLVDMSMNESIIEVDSRYIRDREIWVKITVQSSCCSQSFLPRSYRPAISSNETCLKSLEVTCTEGILLQNGEYVGSTNATCGNDTKWTHPENSTCYTVDNNMTASSITFKAGANTSFFCDFNSPENVLLVIGNEVIAEGEGGVLAWVNFEPEHHGQEAVCKEVSGSGVTTKEKRQTLEILFPPTMDPSSSYNFTLDIGISGFVIVNFRSNPLLRTNTAISMIGPDGGERNNFYLHNNQSSEDTTNSLVVDFIKVKLSDFGQYRMKIKHYLSKYPVIINFNIGEAEARNEEQDTSPQTNFSSSSVAAVILGFLLFICLIGLVVLAVLYARKPSTDLKSSETAQVMPRINQAADLYLVPDAYENINVPNNTARDENRIQNGIYANENF